MLNEFYITTYHWNLFDSVIDAHEKLGIEIITPMGYLINITDTEWPDLTKFGV